jgi:Flp pilus assembly pilin Flp
MQSEMTQEKKRERGAGLVEYTILVALLAMVSLGAVKVFGIAISDSLTSSRNAIAAAGDIEP